MRVFGISGFSGTGKTTLVEQLVKALKSKGYSVATVKSSREDYSSPEGTDSWRHEKAGADPAILLGPHSTSVRYATRRKVEEILEGESIDFLLIEGFKEENLPKIWCTGSRPVDPEEIPSSAVAVVTWAESTVDLRRIRKPVLRSNDIEKLTQIVMKQSADISMLEI
jgi:molybdopterin-guanine dinucleotide biosynthesis protein B